jgi:hypothetical protein
MERRSSEAPLLARQQQRDENDELRELDIL